MKTINLEQFLKMLENGKNNLSNHRAVVDALNVFPVPDGDTGSNMTMTFTAGVNDTLKTSHTSIADASKALSRGLLMGARGNSGVILSQIFRGVSQYLQTVEVVDANQLSEAFNEGARVAYKAVIKPVEGTILTVIREAAYYTALYVNEEDVDCVQMFEKFVAEAHTSLNKTPELLPILKEAGVVDSGGRGLVYILEGFLEALKGNVIASEKVNASTSTVAEHEHDEFGYCTEFIIRLDESKYFSEEKLKEELLGIGNSLVVVTQDDLVKVHVHTLTPGVALNFGQQYGEFVKLKIENMQEQHENLQPVAKQQAKYGLIAVALGEGTAEVFKDLRVDYIVSGGQTMNPSTEDFVSAIEKLNAETVYILPNNSNIILAAQQAATILEDRNIVVLPSKSIPQGMNACMMFNPDSSVENNTENMLEAINEIQTGQVTYAVKDTVFDGVEIKENEFIAIHEKSIITSSQSKVEALKVLLSKMVNEESEVIFLLLGEDIDETLKEEVSSYIEENFDVELEAYQGNQPVYSFIVGVI